MSVKLMGQVWGLKLTRGQRDVLLALADHADDLGNCFPGVEYLAWKTDYSERQVQRLLRQLEADKLVEVVDAGGGSGMIRRYRLHLENGVKKSPFMSRKKGDTTSPSQTKRVTSEAENGDTAMSPEPKATTRQPQKRPPPASAAGPETEKATAQTLLAEHLDALGHDLVTKGRLASTIKGLLTHGATATEARAALTLMRQRNLTHPSVLAGLVDECRGQRNGSRNGDRRPPPEIPEADLASRPPRHDPAAMMAWSGRQVEEASRT